MTDNLIPDDVAQFILDKIDSVRQLEALLLLRGDPSHEWSADALAKKALHQRRGNTRRINSPLCDGFLTATGDKSACEVFAQAGDL